MYKPGTILARRDPLDEDNSGAVYNRVNVVGQSPVDHALISSEWTAGNGQGVIIQPLEGFGATLDEPFGRLQELYEVESIPEPVTVPAAAVVKVVTQGDLPPSPEEQFAAVSQDQSARRAKRVAKVDALSGEIDPDGSAAKRKAELVKEAKENAK